MYVALGQEAQQNGEAAPPPVGPYPVRAGRDSPDHSYPYYRWAPPLPFNSPLWSASKAWGRFPCGPAYQAPPGENCPSCFNGLGAYYAARPNWPTALGADATPAELEAWALNHLPACYSDGFHQCFVNEHLDAYPSCKRFVDAYHVGGDTGPVNQAVRKIPYCPEPAARMSEASLMSGPVGLAVAAVVGAAVGWMAGKASSKG